MRAYKIPENATVVISDVVNINLLGFLNTANLFP